MQTGPERRRYFEPRRYQGKGRVVAVLPTFGAFFLVSFEPFTYSQDGLLEVGNLDAFDELLIRQ